MAKARNITDRRSANNSYKRTRECIAEEIATLQDLLAKMDKAQAKDPHDWGYVGNVDHVFAELTDIVQFAKSE